MDLNYIRRVLKIFDESNSRELTIEENNTKLYLSKNSPQEQNNPNQNQVFIPYLQQYPQLFQQQPVMMPQQAQVETAKVQPEMPVTFPNEAEQLHKINSPMVGTFYRAASPDSAPFVEIGAHVTIGTTLCIIEAMKLMNEIESDISGTVVNILIQNGQAVEYNQILFMIKPD